MSLRDGAMRKDTFEIHAALVTLVGRDADGEPHSDCRERDRPPFHVIRIAWVSFVSRFRQVRN